MFSFLLLRSANVLIFQDINLFGCLSFYIFYSFGLHENYNFEEVKLHRKHIVAGSISMVY